MTGIEHISQEDLALYALQAFSDAEAAPIRAHLVECNLCSAQLAEVSGDTAMIGLSVDPLPVPTDSRQRFMKRIAEDAAKKQTRGKVVDFPRTAWMPWAAAAVLAIAAILLGVKVGVLNHELNSASSQLASLNDESARAREVLDVLTSNSTQRVLLVASNANTQPAGRAIYLADRGGLVFQASNLKQIAADKTYELWLIPASGKPIPAGLFRPDASGSASVVLPPLPAGVPAKAFGVTLEKAEGSDTPTAPILLAGAAAPSSGE